MMYMGYKYKTDNESHKIISKIFPFDNRIFVSGLFHIIDMTLDDEEIEEKINWMYEKYPVLKEEYDSYDEDDSEEYTNYNIEKINEFRRSIGLPDIDSDTANEILDDDMFEDSDEDLSDAYFEYIDVMVLYLENIICCDEVITYNLNDKYVVLGISFSTSIDNEVKSRYLELANQNYKVANVINSFKDYTYTLFDIINSSTGISVQIQACIIASVLNFLNKNEGIDRYKITLPEQINATDVKIAPIYKAVTVDNIELYSTTFAIIVDKYIDEVEGMSDQVTKVLTEYYDSLVSLSYVSALINDIDSGEEVFKYDNDKKSCLFLECDVGGLYLFIDGYSSRQ